MQNTASVLTDQFPDLLKRLPVGLDLDRLARETKAIQRKRKIGDGASLLRLALARGPGGFSLRQTSGWVSLLEIAELSNPGVHYRLKQAVAFLAALVGRLLAAKLPGANLRWPGRTLRPADGTCVSKPGSKGTDWRVHGVFDLGSGGFSHLELTDKHGAEALERGAPIAGEIRIGDRNYARVPVLKRFLADSGGKADFIVRLGWNALQLSTPRGKPFDLIGYLQRLPAGITPHEVTLRAAAGRGEAALPLRLIVQRKTPEAAEATRLALRRAAIKKGKKLDPCSLIAAEFMILVTSLPRKGYTAKDILAVYRLRWQIELAFKRLKSLLHIDRLPTRTEAGSRSWLYAHLILALLCDDLSQDFLESSPGGLARRGLHPITLGRAEDRTAGADFHHPRSNVCRRTDGGGADGSPPARQRTTKAKAARQIPCPWIILAPMGLCPLLGWTAPRHLVPRFGCHNPNRRAVRHGA